ncbi:hypothetical protein SAMN05444411_102234 [Lutibacter oricola]|uniref:Uncharacterized protein n=1 Tax=Lutibacter oricola TaxID=762486 RepID=A0A1H2WLU8_9FLAO|nr:hypothetical protein [Lutibacter oricola]SDW81602.1 hypothetical protein SAMN05444411_102234 [Lutibacter oricola]
MKNSDFKYKSLHEYLDVALYETPNPTHKQIKQAKKAYWRSWFRHYHRQRREDRKEFTLGFDRQSLQLINQKRGKLSVSKFLYQAVATALNTHTIAAANTELLDTIHIQLMELISLVEELLDLESIEISITMFERLEALELQFNKLKNDFKKQSS